MEIAALSVLGVGVVVLTIAVIILARANANVTPSLVAYGKTTADCIKNQALAENERDTWKIKAVSAEAELVQIKIQLVSATGRLTKAIEEKARENVEEIRNAPGASEALNVLDRVLQELPSLPSAKPPAATGG